MSWRLLSSDDKLANARGRSLRCVQQQAHRRRIGLLRELTDVLGGDDSEVLEWVNPADCLELLTAHLHRARSAAVHIKRVLRAAKEPIAGASAGTVSRPLAKIERPFAMLRSRNRSRIRPGTLPTVRSVSHDMALVDVLEQAGGLVREGHTGSRLLRRLAQASTLPCSVLAEMLVARDLVSKPLAPAEIVQAETEMRFWALFEGGMAMFRAGLVAGEFSNFEGRWAYFDGPQLLELLPGLRLPRHFKRTGYLAKLVSDPRGLCLDLHGAPHGFPLTRHLFG